jgi:hypothetical protein
VNADIAYVVNSSETSTSGNLARWNGTSGRWINDSGYSAGGLLNLALLAEAINNSAMLSAEAINNSAILAAATTNLTAYKGATGNFTVLAQSMIPDSNGGATINAPATTGVTAGPLTYVYLTFPTGSQTNASFTSIMPGTWNGGTLTATFYWSPLAASSNTVTWGFDGFCTADGGSENIAYGTAQTVTDTATAAYSTHISAATAATTMGGTKAPGNLCFFQVYRNGGTMASDAALLAVRITYGIQ